MWTILFLACLIGAFALTGVAIRLAARLSMLDHGGQRALHIGTKPRGGGIAIVFCVTAAQIAWFINTTLKTDYIVVWWAGGLLMAALGFWDDIRSLPSVPRLLFQLLVAAIVAVCSAASDLPVVWVAVTVATLAIVWMINGANFMDGADGLLATQVILVSAGSVVLSEPQPADPIRLQNLAVCSACLGFVAWNWQPSKIFLGDTGSYFLGYCLAINVIATLDNSTGLLKLLILATPLYCDASMTLVARVLAKRKFWEAHRSHLYQRMIRCGFSHSQVAMVYALVWGLVFFPLAYLCEIIPDRCALIFVLACIVASVMWFFATQRFSRLLISKGEIA
ncbi:MAG: glycosyltransferase family 4 protein [Pseudomonadota bacterium]